MTREEAIERLTTDIHRYADFSENPNEIEFWDAWDMAIGTLKQETISHSHENDDCISRQAAIDIATKEGAYGYISAQELAELPSVRPEQKHGKWVEDVAFYDEEGCPCIVTRCNRCGEANPANNYCPNCGSYNGGNK